MFEIIKSLSNNNKVNITIIKIKNFKEALTLYLSSKKPMKNIIEENMKKILSEKIFSKKISLSNKFSEKFKMIQYNRMFK
tara:strand:+ start:411 stop:650 length:240 start_codon:yes stop_codon:yes gene_type:complete